MAKAIAQGMYISETEQAQAEMAKVAKGVQSISETVDAFIADTKELDGCIGRSLEGALVALTEVQKEADKAVDTSATCTKTMVNFIEDTKAIAEDHKVNM